MRFIPLAIVTVLFIWAVTSEWCSPSKHRMVGCAEHGYIYQVEEMHHGQCSIRYTNQEPK